MQVSGGKDRQGAMGAMGATVAEEAEGLKPCLLFLCSASTHQRAN